MNHLLLPAFGIQILSVDLLRAGDFTSQTINGSRGMVRSPRCALRTFLICPVFGRFLPSRKSLSFDVTFAQFLLVFANPIEDPREAGAQISFWRPGQLLSGFAIVRPIEDDVALARLVAIG